MQITRLLSAPLAVCALAMSLIPAVHADSSGSPLLITLDRPDAVYAVGEQATFSIQSQIPTAVKVHWSTSLDGYRTLDRGECEAASGTPATTVSATLDRPGFLQLVAVVKAEDGKTLSTVCAAAFSPEQIEPSLPAPDDFDAFWADQKKALAATPLAPELSPVTLSGADDAALVAYDAQIPVGADGPPVSGYLALPKNAAPGSLPAVLWVHGAGVNSSSLPAALGGARDGFLSMDINAHGLPNGKPKEYYKALADGELKGYRTEGNLSRDTVYFRGMFVRLQRALDFLASRPEWNGKTLAVVGHSQGGYQALVAGGLDPRVTFIGSGVPAGCDHSGMKADRISGWPKIVALQADKTPVPESLEACRYYDAVNFATRCKAEAIVSVGFIDFTCPPTSVYAAYNALPGHKQMLNRPAMGHATTPDIRDAFREALLKHVGGAAAKAGTE